MAGPGRGAGLKRVITPEDGWSAIVNALAEAQAGDLVRLSEGRFEGAETLSIPAGVSLVGAGNGGDGDDPDGPTTLLRFVADAPAIELREAHGARLSSLRVVMAPEAVAWRALPEATPVNMSLPVDERPLMEWGAVFADRAEGLDLSELSISAANPDSGLKGIVFRICDGCALTDSHVWGFGGSGISAISSLDQRIEQVSSLGNAHGIGVMRSEAALDRTSRAGWIRRARRTVGSSIICLMNELRLCSRRSGSTSPAIVRAGFIWVPLIPSIDRRSAWSRSKSELVSDYPLIDPHGLHSLPSASGYSLPDEAVLTYSVMAALRGDHDAPIDPKKRSNSIGTFCPAGAPVWPTFVIRSRDVDNPVYVMPSLELRDAGCAVSCAATLP